jgi:phage N-6-adenine-methyltransferase
MNTAVMMSSAQQDWRTPKALFKAVSAIAGRFDVDLAADNDNTLCPDFFCEESDALQNEWQDEHYWPVTRAWLNPPYGPALAKFAAKAVEQVSRHRDLEVWMLVPARVDTRWWNLLMTRACDVLFLAGRVKFERVDGARDSAPFPSAVIRLKHDGGDPKVIWGWRPGR